MLFGKHIGHNKGFIIFNKEENNFMLPKPPPEEERGDEKEHTHKKRNKATAIGIVFGFCFMLALMNVAVICFIIDAVSAVELFKSLASIIIALCSLF